MPTTVLVMMLLLTSLDALLLARLLLRSRELRAYGLLLALGAWVLLSALRAPLLGFFSFTLFGVLSLLYLGLIVMIPGLCAYLLLRRRRQQLQASAGATVLLFLGLCAPPLLAAYASWFELGNTQLEHARFTMSAKRAGRQPIKVGVLSDIQTPSITAHERDAVQRLLAERPDVILIAGDLFQGSEDDLAASLDDFHALLNSLQAPGGVYFVEGDAEREARTRQLLAGTQVQYLYNEAKSITVKDRVITLLGLALSYDSRGALDAMSSLQRDPAEGDIRIVLSHRPDSVLSLPEGSRVDLVVAGHTHGGQVRLPWIGPLLTLTAVPREVAAGGAHEVKQNAIYVSRGLGREGGQAPPIRFLCPPEVAILTLE